MQPEAQRCLSVVMPCYNEAATVRTVVERVLASPYTAEVIAVDDGSTDGTLERLADFDDPRLRLLRQPANRGKGAALRRGFAEATAPYVIVQDADLEYDPDDYGTVLGPLLDGKADVVYGSRFHSGSAHRVLYYWHAVGNRFLTTASNMFTNLNLTDMETCYKAFRREVIQDITIQEDRFGFEPEVTAKVARGGWRVYEVGISYAGRTYAEGKKIGWRDGVRALRCVVRYSGARDRLAGRPPQHGAVAARPAGFDDADAELADTLESLEGATRYRDWIYGLLEPHLGTDVLEVGAGHGSLTERLAEGRRVTATELSRRCVDVLEKKFAAFADVEVHREDVAASAAAGRAYDSAVLVNVLEHVADDAGALRELRSALKPGGHLLVFAPAFERLYSDFDRTVGHYRRYRRSALAETVEEAGFEVVDARYVNPVGALAWWVVAKVLRRDPTEARAVVPFDRLAVPVLRRLEDGRRPPFGQSVLCVARRPPEAPPPPLGA